MIPTEVSEFLYDNLDKVLEGKAKKLGADFETHTVSVYQVGDNLV